MKKFLVIFLVSLAMSGCSLLAPKTSAKVAQAVNIYCTEPLATRLVLRAEVNSMVAPNAVKVTCVGDPE